MHLFPGEETIFELKVVNHGDPSNISVEASDPLIKAVRLKRPDHYIVLEENIPILARLPEGRKRVDGELLINSQEGTSRVPISLVRELEGSSYRSCYMGGPGDEQVDDGGEGEEYIRDRGNMQKQRDEEEVGSDEYPSDDESGRDEGHEFDQEFGESSDEDSDDQPVEDSESRDDRGARDVENYRAMRRRRRAEYLSSLGNGNADVPDYQQSDNYQQDDISKDYRQDSFDNYDSGTVNETEGSEDSARGKLAFNFPDNVDAFQTIPLAILACLILVLILTFYTGNIPEFLGALTSSILIVTLIIYGASTLLKA